MGKKIREAFNQIHADEALKLHTICRVKEQLERRHYRPVFFKRLFLRPVRSAVAVCSLLFLTLGGFGGYRMYYAEAAAVSIDINPSIELSLNRWGVVVGENGFGQDGEAWLSTVNLTHLRYEQAVERLLTSDMAEGYLAEGAVVSVTLEAGHREEEEQLLRGLEASVNQTLTQHHEGVTAEYGCASSQEREEAHHYGMSVGKYCAIRHMIGDGEETEVGEWKDKSMEEIMGNDSGCRGMESGGHGHHHSAH